MSERRRAGRLNVRLLMQIAGVDDEPILRRCNLSTTGLYFDINREVGHPGTVQKLTLITMDSKLTVEVMSRVVRVITNSDIWKGSTVAGIAMDFMLPNTAARNEVEQLMLALMRHEHDESLAPVPAASQPGLQWSYRATAQTATPAHAPQTTSNVTIQALSSQGMFLETEWAAQVGEVIRCEVEAPVSKRRLVLSGEVSESHSNLDDHGNPVYRVRVNFRSDATPALPAAAPVAVSINEAIDALLEEALAPVGEQAFPLPNEHLAGLLSRIRLGSLLTFLEVERLEGELSVTQGSDTAKVHLQAGRIIDAEGLGGVADPLDVLDELLTWDDGKFEFRATPVARADRIKMSTMHILLKLTHEDDESARA